MSNTIDRDWRNASILPLNIVYFSANYTNNIANLLWNVENELQNNYYEIEYSNNGLDFSVVGKVLAKNSNRANYNFAHNLVGNNNQLLYYRIKQVDKAGKIFYTNTVVLRINKTKEVSVGPNPFNDLFNVSISSETTEIALLQLFSNDGKLVYQKQVDLKKGLNAFQVNGLYKLSSGLYTLTVQSATGLQKVRLLKK